jgi:hypothetical protein
MALAQLTPEETQTWTREEKDRWWFEKIYRGDLPQLTIRSGLTGFLLGGVLSATNLYVGGKTGVTLGVGLTSVILAFAAFRLFTRVGIGKEFTILENNAMQSIATSGRIHDDAADLEPRCIHVNYRCHRAVVADCCLDGGDVARRCLGRVPDEAALH